MTLFDSVTRRVLSSAALFAFVATLIVPGVPEASAQRRMTQGGRGPIQVLLVTKGHGFDREGFFNFFDALGEAITWTHVEQPAAQAFWDPKMAEPYDVFVYYDAMGRREMAAPDGSKYFEKPSLKAQDDLKALLQSGKGMVFFHHSIAAWNQAWPEYTEIVGGACDWGNPVTVRGKEYPNSGAQGGVEQHIGILAKDHPIVQGLGDGFDIVDETYLCPYFTDSFTPLLRTDFEPVDKNFIRRYERGWRHPEVEGSDLAGWVKTAEQSPIVYLQNGHDRRAWENEAFQKLMTNAIEWAASDEALQWAKEHPQKIFK